VRSPTRILCVISLALATVTIGLLLPGAAGAAASHPAPPPDTCQSALQFRAADFARSTKIDNRFLPLEPGTQLILQGRSNVNGAALPHTVTFTVTDLIKKIDDVWNLVMWDVDVSDGVTTEAELAFFAQDKAGNVWNMGEYPEEYEDGKFVGAPSTWISGQRATPGVHMLADPASRVGKPAYLQGYVPDLEFLDCARVFAKNQTVRAPAGTYTNVLVTDETSPLEDPDAHQRKFHAPGVGIVQVGAVDDPQAETLVLTSVGQLGPQALAHARQEALKLDRHAYQVSRVYRTTVPAIQCLRLDGVPGRFLDNPLVCP
jgi:hypothetical protein